MRRFTPILALAAAAGTVLAAPVPVESAMQRLGLEQGDITPSTITQAVPGERLLSMNFEGIPVTFRLVDDSIRAPGFKVFVQDETGTRREIEAPPSRAVRGTIDGLPGADVRGTLVDGRFSGMVVLDDVQGRQIWGVEPASDQGTELVVYRVEDVTPIEGVCGVNGGALMGELAQQLGIDPSVRGAGSPDIAEIGLDADFNLYQDFGQNTTNVTNRLELIFTGINIIYERDVNVTFDITGIVIRTSSATDPYGTNDAGTLLDTVRNQWANIDDIPHDLAHMVSGRNFNGGTLGIAFLGTVCTNSGVGANQHLNNLTSVVGLISHEAGHNFNATHCDGNGDCHIMCSGLGGCNGLGIPNFGVSSVNRIRSFANGRSCLNRTDVPYPFFEPFTAGIDSDIWPSSAGVTVVNDNAAPSAPQVARLDAGEALQSVAFNFIGSATNTAVQWFSKTADTADTQSLALEYFFNDTWNLVGYAPASTSFEQITLPLPPDARRANMPLRFRAVSGTGAYFLDNIAFEPIVDPVATAALPFFEDFNLGALPLERWERSTALVQPAPTSPGGQSALVMGNNQTVITTEIDASGLGQDAILGFFAANTGPSFDAVNVEYRDAGGVYRVLGFILGSETTAEYELFEYTIPQADLSSTLKIRLTALTSGANWFIDDLQVSDESRVVVDECPADWNGSGAADIFDVLDYLSDWNSGDLAADQDGNMMLNVFDILSFLETWNTGCP